MQPMSGPTVGEIEREVVHMTYIVGRYGERYRPILDSLTGHLEARRRLRPSPEWSMPKRLRPLPDRSEVTDDTPLHLDTEARLAFPDGVVTSLALRGAAARGDLEYERLGSRVVTTLRFIREWRERSRHPVKSAAERRGPAHHTDKHRAARLRALSKPTKTGRTRRPKG